MTFPIIYTFFNILALILSELYIKGLKFAKTKKTVNMKDIYTTLIFVSYLGVLFFLCLYPTYLSDNPKFSGLSALFYLCPSLLSATYLILNMSRTRDLLRIFKDS